MRVALCFPGCHRRGGVERVVYECARHLSSAGHEVDVFANKWEAIDSPRVRFHHVYMPKQPPFLRTAWYFHQSSRMVKASGSYDVVSTHGTICPTDGVYWVQSLHRAWLEQSKTFRKPMSLARWKQRINPLHPVLLRLEELHFARRRYRRVIATTEAVRRDLRRYYDVPPEDVTIVPNGFSPREFNPAVREAHRAAARQRLGLAPRHVALLFAANELERKGYPTLLAAMRRLRRPELRLLVVGRPSTAAVREQADRAGVAEQVIACGSTTDIAGFHAACDAFVLPTQYEAFSLAILEALGSGVPVLTTRVPGAHDAVQHEVNGLLIDDPCDARELADALERMLDAPTRDGLSARAPASVESYQWPIVLRRYEAVLQNAVARVDDFAAGEALPAAK